MTRAFKVGDEIMGLFGDGCWYDGVIESEIIDDIDRFIVRWDDGDDSEKIKSTAQLRLRKEVVAVPVTPRTPRDMTPRTPRSNSARSSDKLTSDAAASQAEVLPASSPKSLSKSPMKSHGSPKSPAKSAKKPDAVIEDHFRTDEKAPASPENNGRSTGLQVKIKPSDTYHASPQDVSRQAAVSIVEDRKTSLAHDCADCSSGTGSEQVVASKASRSRARRKIKGLTKPDSAPTADVGAAADRIAKTRSEAGEGDSILQSPTDAQAQRNTTVELSQAPCPQESALKLQEQATHGEQGGTQADVPSEDKGDLGACMSPVGQPHHVSAGATRGGAQHVELDAKAMSSMAATEQAAGAAEPSTECETAAALPADASAASKPAGRRLRLVKPDTSGDRPEEQQGAPGGSRKASSLGKKSVEKRVTAQELANEGASTKASGAHIPKAEAYTSTGSISSKPKTVPSLHLGEQGSHGVGRQAAVPQEEHAARSKVAADLRRKSPSDAGAGVGGRAPSAGLTPNSRRDVQHATPASSSQSSSTSKYACINTEFDTKMSASISKTSRGLTWHAPKQGQPSATAPKGSPPQEPPVQRVSQEQLCDIAQRMSTDAVKKKRESLRSLMAEEEDRLRQQVSNFTITPRTRAVCAAARGSSQHGDIVSRLEYDEQERRLKLQGLREEQERRELAECTSPVIDGKSKYLASGWAARGDVLTRLSKLAVDKRRAAIGRVRDEMYLEEEEQMAGFTIDERSQELAVRRCAQGDVVTRLFHLDTEARRDKIGRLKAAFREQEDAELTFAPAGAGGKRSADKTKRGTGADDVFKRLAYVDLEVRREKLNKIIEDEERRKTGRAVGAGSGSADKRNQLAGRRLAQGDIFTRLGEIDVQKKKEVEEMMEAQRKAAEAREALNHSAGKQSLALHCNDTRNPLKAELAAKRTAQGDVWTRLAEVDVEQWKDRMDNSARGKTAASATGNTSLSADGHAKQRRSTSPVEDAVVKRLFEERTEMMLRKRREMELKAEQELNKSTEKKVFMSEGTRRIIESSGLRQGATLEERTQRMQEKKAQALEAAKRKEEEELIRLQSTGSRARSARRCPESRAGIAASSLGSSTAAAGPHMQQDTPGNTSQCSKASSTTKQSPVSWAEEQQTTASEKSPADQRLEEQVRMLEEKLVSEQEARSQEQREHVRQMKALEEDNLQQQQRLMQAESDLKALSHKVTLRETELEGARSRNRVQSSELLSLRNKVDEANRTKEEVQQELAKVSKALEMSQQDLAQALKSKFPPAE